MPRWPGRQPLTNFADQEAARDDLPPEPFEDVASEVAGFDPGAEPKVEGTGSKPEPLKDDDDDFTSMVLAATPRANRAPGGPSQRPIRSPKPPLKPITEPITKTAKKISIIHEGVAKAVHPAVKAAIDHLHQLHDGGDQLATFIDFLRQADATLLLTKKGFDWQPIVDKVSEANNQLMNFLKQLSDPNWIKEHISTSIDPEILNKGIKAWTIFTQALGRT